MEKLKNKEGGFLRLIILIVILILLMNYYDISLSDMNDALKRFFDLIIPQ